MAERATRPWESPGYSDIVAVRLAASDIEVEFANGDVVLAPGGLLGIAGDGARVEFDPGEGMSFRVDTEGGKGTEVTWEQVRAATDPEFAQEMRRRDTEEARRLGLRLKALREDRNLSQRDLATLVGMSGPQLSKIESGAFDLRLSTVQTLLRTMGASLADIAGPDAPEVSQRELRRRVRLAGVPADVLDRLLTLLPRGEAVSAVARAFNWTPDALLTGVPTTTPVPALVRFKASGKHEPADSPLVSMAYVLSKRVRESAVLNAYAGIPSDPADIRRDASDNTGHVTLATLLDWMWRAGIPVVPMYGTGVFSAAAWMIDAVPVVVLKDARELAVFWLFDLAHELGHIALQHVDAGGVIDVESPRPRGEDADEQAASDFALALLLPEHQRLLSEVRAETRGNYLRFKGAVATVARRVEIQPGVLGMVAAYEITEVGQPKDRWGSANNLAKAEGAGRPIVQRAAKRFIRADRMQDVDSLLIRALVTDAA